MKALIKGYVGKMRRNKYIYIKQHPCIQFRYILIGFRLVSSTIIQTKGYLS